MGSDKISLHQHCHSDFARGHISTATAMYNVLALLGL